MKTIITLVVILALTAPGSASAQGSGFMVISLLGAGVFIGSYTHDLATTSHSVRRHNLRRIADPNYFRYGMAPVNKKEIANATTYANLSPLIVGTGLLIAASKKDSYQLAIGGLGLIGLTVLIAPGTGHWLAGNPRRAWHGVLIRALSLTVISMAGSGLANLPED